MASLHLQSLSEGMYMDSDTRRRGTTDWYMILEILEEHSGLNLGTVNGALQPVPSYRPSSVPR